MPGVEFGPWEPLPLSELRAAMASFPARWWVTGGHALELAAGRSWRAHDDVDIGICRRDAPHLLAALPDWEVVVAAAGRLCPWDGRELVEAHHENNLWCRRPGGPWCLDVAIGSGDGDRWVYRRDPRFTLPWDRALRAAGGLRYLAPGPQLLFKSNDVRPKDQADAEELIPSLDAESLSLLDLHLPAGHEWSAMVRTRRRGMPALDVLEILDVLSVGGADVVVDGGWGIDALLGRQTRQHGDLDLALATREWSAALVALAAEGFVPVRDDGPHNVVLGDPLGRLVDLHAYDDSTQQVGADGVTCWGPDGLAYRVDGFGATGTVAGRTVRCMTAAFQMASHSTYVPDEDDWRDVSALHARFGLPIPASYARWAEGG